MLRRPFIAGAAVICGLSIYFPIMGFRGAAFCLFPGIAQRSRVTALKGAVCGFCADLIVCIAWMFLGFAWEPRLGLNSALADYLPPEHMIVTHTGCPIPNGLQFGLGLVLWTSAMFGIWMWYWSPYITWHKRILVHIAGAVSVSLAAAMLWIVAPMDEWWHYGAAPFGDLPPVPFLVLFLSSMPLCSLIVALMIFFTSKYTASTTSEVETIAA